MKACRRQRFGGDAGPAVGQHVRQVDDLERLDQPDQDDRAAHRQDRRPGDVAEDLPAAGAVDHGGLDLVAGWFSSAASSTMNMNGIHCQVSPIITASRAPQGSVGPGEVGRGRQAARTARTGPCSVSASMRKV